MSLQNERKKKLKPNLSPQIENRAFTGRKTVAGQNQENPGGF
jgi:hypothetical protein